MMLTESEPKYWILTLYMDNPQLLAIVQALLILMGLDIVTGLLAAFISKTLNSTTSFIGVSKKVQMLFFVGAGLAFETIYPQPPWGQLIAGLFIITETISIIENVDKSGIPIPKKLRQALKSLREDVDKDEQQNPPIEGTDNHDHTNPTR